MSTNRLDGNEQSRLCPRCGKSLLVLDKQLLLFRCPLCKGVFTKSELETKGGSWPEPQSSAQQDSRAKMVGHEESASNVKESSSRASSHENNSKGVRNALIALAVFFGLASTSLGMAWYNSNKSLGEATQKIQSQTATIQEQQTSLARLNSELASAYTTLEVTKNNLATTQSELAVTGSQLTQTKNRLVETQGKLTGTESQLTLYRDTWGSVVASDIKPPYQDADIANSPNATNPTWERLLNFLRADKTDEKPYVPDVNTCGDYARDVHNNAERLGIRSAWVAIKFSDVYHACNAFKTTDRGLVFIDCTGLKVGMSGPSNCDKIVSVKLGKDYTPMSLAPQPGWEVVWKDMGNILDVQVYW